MQNFDFEKFSEKYGKNAIAFKFTDKKAEPLQTKIGGKPDLPPDFEWYYYEGTDYNDVKANRPLSFMAQINCAEIRKYDRDNLLPEIAVEFQTFRDIPDYCETCLLDDFEFPDDEDDEFDELYNEKRYEGFPDGLGMKLLGYADIIQDIMQYQCEYVSRRYDIGEGFPEMSETEEADIKNHMQDWILLFQMDSIEAENFEFMFGDCGRIYFWIRKDDLKNRNFDNIQLILQCC